MQYDYEYFCGANCVVEIGGLAVTELVALSYSVNENKVPIYGYASRYFDAVGLGNIIIEGTLAINFVEQNYMHYLIQSAGTRTNAISTQTLTTPNDPMTRSPLQAIGDRNVEGQLLELSRSQFFGAEETFAKELQAAYWNDPSIDPSRPDIRPYDNVISNVLPINIKITFGERSARNAWNGKTNVILSDVYFRSKGKGIQISEDVIIEQYSFFARNEFRYVGTAPTVG